MAPGQSHDPPKGITREPVSVYRSGETYKELQYHLKVEKSKNLDISQLPLNVFVEEKSTLAVVYQKINVQYRIK